MIRIILFECSAVVAATVLAWNLRLPETDSIDPGTIKIEVVELREPFPVPGEIIDVGPLTNDYIHPPDHIGCAEGCCQANYRNLR